MTGLREWRAVASVALAAGILLPLALARGAGPLRARAGRARGGAVAAYLTVVTPPPRAGRGGGYDLPAAPDSGPGARRAAGVLWTVRDYHATAPLVRATAAPLPAATLQRVAERPPSAGPATRRSRHCSIRDGWDVVGAVAARPAALAWPVSPWSAGALLLLLIAGAQACERSQAAPRVAPDVRAVRRRGPAVRPGGVRRCATRRRRCD